MGKRIILMIGVLTVCLLAASCGSDGQPSSGEDGAAGEITVAVSAKNSATYFAIQEGVRLGIWDDTGLDVKLLDATSTSATQALASGDADVMVQVGTAGALAQAQGVDIKLVGMILPTSTHSLIVPTDSDYDSPEDLRGKKFGISGFGSGGHYATAMMAESLGWSKDDYELVVLGDQNAIIAAFNRGDIDAFMWSPEVVYAMVNDNEGRILVSSDKYIPPYVHAGFFATSDLVDNQPEALKEFLDRYYAYIGELQKDDSEELEIMTADWKLNPEVASDVANLVNPQLATSAEVPEANLQVLSDAVTFIEPSVTSDPNSLYVNGQTG